MVFANARVSEGKDFFTDTFDLEDKPQGPERTVLDVSLARVLNIVKLAWSNMRRDGVYASVILATSATAYAPEQSLPVYSASKLVVRAVLLLVLLASGVLLLHLLRLNKAPVDLNASAFTQLVGIVRTLRSKIIREGITIDAVALAATITKL